MLDEIDFINSSRNNETFYVKDVFNYYESIKIFLLSLIYETKVGSIIDE